MDLEESSLECRDSVQVWDGVQQTRTFCGTSLPPPYSSFAGTVVVSLHTDAHFESSGFALNFSTKCANNVTTAIAPTIAVYCEPYVEVGGFNGTVHGHGRPSGVQCMWSISVSGLLNQVVRVVFVSLNVSDELRVLDGALGDSIMVNRHCLHWLFQEKLYFP